MLRCTYDVKLNDLPVRLFFSSEDARETGMGCWLQTFLLASLKRIVFMPDDVQPKLYTRIVKPCWTLANASLYILPIKLLASLWQWCSITSCVQWRDLKRMKLSLVSFWGNQWHSRFVRNGQDMGYHFGFCSGCCIALLYRCYRVAGWFHRKESYCPYATQYVYL